MAIQLLLTFLSLTIFFLWYWLLVRNKNPPIYQWPLLGMLPSLLLSLLTSNLHDFITIALRRTGGTFLLKGSTTFIINAGDYIVTSDPTNIHHIFSKNAANYEKGRYFKDIMEAMGDGIFNSDGESWKFQRQLIHSLLNNSEFDGLHTMQTLLQGRMETTLFPVLDNAITSSRTGNEEVVNMQDLMRRFMLENVCLLVLGVLPDDTMCGKAFEDIEEAIVFRHVVPECVWRLQNRLQIGVEGRMIRGLKIMDHFLYRSIEFAKKKKKKQESTKVGNPVAIDLLTQILVSKDEEIVAKKSDTKFLRDTAFSLISAGGETVSSGLTWLIWLVSNHPTVEEKMLQELNHVMAIRPPTDRSFLSKDELNELVYLHAIVCETFRLYPPVPFEHKCAVEADVLPSGHEVRRGERILISIYSMGRMEEIWGEDCMEFKPERWISEKGTIVHVSSYKFMTFLAGARTCLGKNMAFLQVKLLASALLWNYKFELIANDGPSVRMAASMVMSMKDGLKTRVSKRDY